MELYRTETQAFDKVWQNILRYFGQNCSDTYSEQLKKLWPIVQGYQNFSDFGNERT